MNKKLLLTTALVAIAIATSLLIYKKTSIPVSNEATVRLNVPFPAIDFAPFYVAKKKGWIEESLQAVGMKPEYLEPFGSIPVTYEALEAGRVDMVMSSEVPPIVHRSNGKDIKIAWLSCTLKSEVVVHKDSSIKDIQDLKGKKVGTLSGSDAHLWLIRNLLEIGLSRSDVTFVNLSPPDGKAAFQTGEIDAWAMFPPFSTHELVDGIAKVIPDYDAPIQVVLVASGVFYREHTNAAEEVVKALEKAKQWIIANPEEAQAIVSEETAQPIEVVRFAWPSLIWEASLNEDMATQMQADANFLFKEELIQSELDVRSDLLIGY